MIARLQEANSTLDRERSVVHSYSPVGVYACIGGLFPSDNFREKVSSSFELQGMGDRGQFFQRPCLPGREGQVVPRRDDCQ
jgi:hypothetical protein